LRNYLPGLEESIDESVTALAVDVVHVVTDVVKSEQLSLNINIIFTIIYDYLYFKKRLVKLLTTHILEIRC
jgi:hypothetical protein